MYINHHNVLLLRLHIHSLKSFLNNNLIRVTYLFQTIIQLLNYINLISLLFFIFIIIPKFYFYNICFLTYLYQIYGIISLIYQMIRFV